MSDNEGHQPPGWYYAHGDPLATQRYWDGTSWVGAPQPVPGSELPESIAQTALPLPRMGARIIDWLLWAVAFTVVGVVFDSTGISDSANGVAVRLATVVIVLTYETVMVMQAGATLGKMTVGLKVVDAAGAEAATDAAVRRSIILAVVGVLWVIGGLAFLIDLLIWPAILAAAIAGFVMLFTGRERRTPWDRVANTVVVPK